MYADELLRPWSAPLRAAVSDLDVFDCHTHVGTNDPSGFAATAEQLAESLEIADARAAVFPLKEPERYGAANLRVAELAREAPSLLVPVCPAGPRARGDAAA